MKASTQSTQNIYPQDNFNSTSQDLANLDNMQSIDAQNQESIPISNSTSDDKNTGIVFIVVLFVILLAFIIALPYISKIF